MSPGRGSRCWFQQRAAPMRVWCLHTCVSSVLDGHFICALQGVPSGKIRLGCSGDAGVAFRVPGCRHVPQHGYASHFRAIRLHEHPSPPADALRPAVADLPAPPNSWLLLNPCKRPPRRRSPAVICRILLACRGVEQTHETGLCLPKPG